MTLTLGFSALGWGRHHALITSLDKPSEAQAGQFVPYSALPLLYPILSYPTLPFPTLPYPTPPHPPPPPYPTLPSYPPLPLPYPTLPYPTLPYHILPHSTQAHPSLPLSIALPYLASLHFKRKFYLVWNHSIKATGTVRVFHSVTSEGFSAPEWG